MHTGMDDNITTLQDVLGACQRILQTPIPLSYTRHTRYVYIGCYQVAHAP